MVLKPYKGLWYMFLLAILGVDPAQKLVMSDMYVLRQLTIKSIVTIKQKMCRVKDLLT